MSTSDMFSAVKCEQIVHQEGSEVCRPEGPQSAEVTTETEAKAGGEGAQNDVAPPTHESARHG